MEGVFVCFSFPGGARASVSPQDSPSPRLPDCSPLSTAPPGSAARVLALAGWATCGQAPTLVCASPAVKRGTARPLAEALGNPAPPLLALISYPLILPTPLRWLNTRLGATPNPGTSKSANRDPEILLRRVAINAGLPSPKLLPDAWSHRPIPPKGQGLPGRGFGWQPSSRKEGSFLALNT